MYAERMNQIYLRQRWVCMKEQGWRGEEAHIFVVDKSNKCPQRQIN